MSQFTLNLTGDEVTIIFNILVRGQYRIGDALLVKPIIDKLQPFAFEFAREKEAEQQNAQKAEEVVLETKKEEN